MFYFIKTPGWLKKIYPSCVWHINTTEKKVYLTFDDGPHPQASPFVLATLDKYRAKATFFCIGKNVAAYPEVYNQILSAGHAVGNHTFNHLNGWKTTTANYLEDIEAAKGFVNSDLFRPPYGKISFGQLKSIHAMHPKIKVIMWSVLSADFDNKITARRCAQHVVNNAMPGAVVVFHDSEKAFEKLRIALPQVLENFTKRGYIFEKIII
jgi:peptidoglycan/xylan/chitin deacetylase (PgdA/CDA1 family)